MQRFVRTRLETGSVPHLEPTSTAQWRTFMVGTWTYAPTKTHRTLLANVDCGHRSDFVLNRASKYNVFKIISVLYTPTLKYCSVGISCLLKDAGNFVE